MIQSNIARALERFGCTSLREAATGLANALGYASERTVETGSVAQFCEVFDAPGALNDPKACKSAWQDVQLVFQLTDDELALHVPLFKEKRVAKTLMQSYVFVAIDLKPGDYSRSTLAGIARLVNRVLPMPVLVMFKISGKLTLAVINRRTSKRDTSRDVLGKVTLVQEIDTTAPHRGHLDILASFSLDVLKEGRRRIASFEDLHAAWEEVFNVELLNKRFYEELANWYFWARGQVWFPNDANPHQDEAAHHSTSVIRLLTRLIFCWFLKEKGLVPARLFDHEAVSRVLANVDANESSYYRAILQNLFFATLNQPMEPEGDLARAFAPDGNFRTNQAHYGVKTLYRYGTLFRDPGDALGLFADIPFLNGGLFACLDTEDDDGTVRYVDGFSRNVKKQPKVPNLLFFSEPLTVDLSGPEAYGDAKKKKAKVRGLLHILDGYKFTIAESTPVEQEIALDPELLGNVFENLLASYNPETGESARRQTGSFYTPRPIVGHMVDVSLKAYLADELCQRVPNTRQEDAQAGLDILFAYTERSHAFNEAEREALIAAIDACNILDPACGSGAYPMGILHKLVFVLGKLDPNNEKWRQRQVAKAEEIEDVEARESAIRAINRDFAHNALDYGRKLYLIENCIYGVDIQPIAIQIAKLRFFISLICDQRTSTDKAANLGIRPLPNLETKFVAADSLIGLASTQGQLFANPDITRLEAQLEKVRHRYFSAQTRKTKLALQKQDRELVAKIGKLLKADLASGDALADDMARRLAWNPYDPHAVAPFFDPETMFGPTLAKGFDVVLGNPPYVQIQKFAAAKKALWQQQAYSTYAATGDIYCLFYERGLQLLREGGQLAYITSNKWMRAGYGEKLRNFFAVNTAVREVIDFGGVLVFNAAMVDTCIVHASKSEAVAAWPSVVMRNDFSLNQSIADYLVDNAIPFNAPPSGAESWVSISPERYRIKQAVAAQGVPLEKWQITINYGIKTGYNEAFYLTTAQRDALVAEDPKCAELIVPLLRGRDVQRYTTEWALLDDDKWMINAHNGIKEQGVPPVDVKRDYPALWRHLNRFKAQLQPRADQGDHWTNLRNCAYLDDFQKPKIIYPNMTKYLPFYYDRSEHLFINDKAFILSSEEESLLCLAAVFNSSLFRCCFIDNFPNLGEDRRELRKIFFDKIPIKKPSATEAALFEALVPMVQAAKAAAQSGNASASPVATFLEEVIDACVMELYFSAYMAEKKLSLHQHVTPLLPANAAKLNDKALTAAAIEFHSIANASQHPVRNILIRIPVDSPELLAVIQREGAV